MMPSRKWPLIVGCVLGAFSLVLFIVHTPRFEAPRAAFEKWECDSQILHARGSFLRGADREFSGVHELRHNATSLMTFRAHQCRFLGFVEVRR